MVEGRTMDEACGVEKQDLAPVYTSLFVREFLKHAITVVPQPLY
jgi:hypothetical protein